MRMKMKRFLGILLTLVLVLGLMPGMSLTAYATEQSVTLTKSATSSGVISSSGFTIMADDLLVIGKNASCIISASSGITITKIIMHKGSIYASNFTSSYVTVSPGTITFNGDTCTVTNVNSSSVTLSKKVSDKNYACSSIEVFYNAPTAYSVTITPGNNMTKTTDSGAASQSDLSGTITDVVYTANDGYYFPTDYSVATVNGISVTRNSYTQITVSGTPTADALISLNAPTAKTKPDAPTTVAAVDCTTADNNDGKLTGVTTAMEYNKSDATDWIAGTGSDITGLVPGTYYVRYKATDTTNASGNQELSIAGYTAPTYEVTYKVVNGTWSDDTTTDRTETVQSGSTPASVPTGMKAASGYTGGAWDTNPAEATITGATTFTYSFTALPTYTVTYKVVNGTWSDDSTADKTEPVQSGSKPASVPTGMKAASGYTGGAWDTNPADTSITGATTFTYTFTEKQAAIVTKAPTAKTLTYNGSAQELLTAGTAEGGTMYYALGENATTSPADNLYTTAIPKATDAGTYHVWYKAVGDDSHTDSVPVCIKVVIEDIKAVVEQKENTPKAAVEGLDEELASDLMNDEEEKKVQSGEKATLTLEMTNIDSAVSQEDKSLTEKTLGSSSKNGKVGMYLDLSLWLKIGSDYARQISETGGKQLTVKFEVPENLRAPAGVTRKFFIFHIHNGVAKKLAETTNITIPITVGEFSTFVLAYEDDTAIDETPGFYSGLKISQKKGKIIVSWDKGEGVAKYAVFATYCGNKYQNKPVKTTKSTSVTIKKIKGKKIDFTKNFKIYVAAYDASGKEIGKTVSAHFAGKDSKKFKNPKSLKLSTKAITLGIGKTSKIKVSVKMEEGKKKDLSDSHAAKFRYRSTNKNVATVDKNGKIKGVAAGTCDVYVYSRNGLAKKVKVTVTD
ncbi:Ig-like domain-containing protein [Butyrivibrio sp. MB2005]|uniref:Ig-like domain-containing protein n=1 Tax=Butyrivibrio sp. MB2005 TaxID=1280678 RepID=UPI000478F508|nr:Ig-like domain-containing protein [Butyrivibrio sp. MB2005]